MIGLAGHISISFIGILYLLLLLIPNAIWLRCKPEGYTAEGENKLLSILEKAGQVAVTCMAVFFLNINIKLEPWILWLAASLVAMGLYEWFWILYFRSRKALRDFYRSVAGIPVAGASLPVMAFLLLAVYGRSIWLLISVIILGIGHIGIHLEHRRKITSFSEAVCINADSL